MASSGKAQNKTLASRCKRSTNNINWNVPLIWHLWSGPKKPRPNKSENWNCRNAASSNKAGQCCVF